MCESTQHGAIRWQTEEQQIHIHAKAVTSPGLQAIAVRMGSSPATGGSQTELRALVQAATAGQPKPVYLFVGEPFATTAAARALVDVLVPEARRAFNLEIYDGRTTPMAAVLDSLRTPGFFAGPKVVWVRETTVLLSGEKRSELTKALLAAWDAGREQEAAEKLLALVALAGWSQEQFLETQWSTLAKSRVREIFGQDLEKNRLVQLDAVQAACVARDLSVSPSGDDGAILLEFLAGKIQPSAILLLTASAADARKRVFKRLQDIGAVLDCTAGRERSGALSRDTVDEMLRRVQRERGTRLEPAAEQLILRRAGNDLALLAMELDKLCLYAADQPAIMEADVRAVFRDMAESWIFDFTNALTTRQLARALPLLRGLVEQGEPPLRLLAMIARELRMLLLARDSLDNELRGKWRGDLPFNAFQGRLLPQLDEETRQAFGNTHPFVLYRRFQDAVRLDGGALRAALVRLSDLDRQIKSSRTDAALLLEAFVIEWCRGTASFRAGTLAHGSLR